MTDLLTTALAYAEAGISAVPVATDGSKRPALRSWKEYQDRRATDTEIREWFAGPNPRHGAVGLITGTISGNLEMAEIEGRAAHQLQGIEDLAKDSGLGYLWAKVCNGWLERSPSGGYHWFYRTHEPPGKNTKLASRPATPEELASNPKEKRKVLTETRGEGGFVVTAPSAGSTHETGQAWSLIAGGPTNIPTLTGEELEQFHFLLASLNVEPPEPAYTAPRSAPSAPQSGMFGAVSPLDDYEARTDWADILLPAGWRHAFTDPAGVRYWTRPGKQWGISATTGKDPERDRLFVFTSATEFEQETPYTKQGAYALLQHGGNHSAAASELRRSGYGKDAEIGVHASTPPQPQLQPGVSPFAQHAPASAGTQPTAGPAAGSAPAPGGNTSAWQPETGQATSPSNTPAPSTSAMTGPAAADGSEWPSQQPGSTEGNLATVTDIAPRIAAPGTTIAHTDDGNAALLIAQHGHELRYNPERGRWLHWTGNVWEWQPGNDGAARELAKNVIRGIDARGDDTARAWKKKSLSASSITNMLTQAQTDARVVVFADQLDANGWELNTPGGIIDLRTATLLPPNPESLHTKMTACAPDFDGTSDKWEGFLDDTFPGDQELRDYVQRMIGYSAVGIVREHVLPMAIGDGGNGKGVTMETSIAVLGDYATTAPAGFLMKSNFQTHSTDLARLHGARMVVCDEAEPGARWDEAKLKALVGGSSITARFMRQDNFTFKPTHQLWTTVNHAPGVEAGGDSFWRRLRAIPFSHTVPDEKKDPELGEKLAEQHGPKILAWIARGAAAYYRHGLAEPENVKAATKSYAHDVDTVARFLELECEVGGEHDYTSINAVRNAYERFCRGNADEPIKGRAFTTALEKHGIDTSTTQKGIGGQRQYRHIRLTSALTFPADTADDRDAAAEAEAGQQGALGW